MIESEDKSEIEMLKDPLKMILKKGLMKLQNIFELQKKQQTICLYPDGLYQDLLNSRVGSLKINLKI